MLNHSGSQNNNTEKIDMELRANESNCLRSCWSAKEYSYIWIITEFLLLRTFQPIFRSFSAKSTINQNCIWISKWINDPDDIIHGFTETCSSLYQLLLNIICHVLWDYYLY